jgi:hypothetical protein
MREKLSGNARPRRSLGDMLYTGQNRMHTIIEELQSNQKQSQPDMSHRLRIYLAGVIRDDHPKDIEWRESFIKPFLLAMQL